MNEAKIPPLKVALTDGLGVYDPGLSPHYELLADYETLIRLARRCAYDLSHVADAIPDDSFYLTSLRMDERARMWVTLFAKGNPGKDYRHKLAAEKQDLARQLDALHDWCKERGLTPPDRRDAVPF